MPRKLGYLLLLLLAVGVLLGVSSCGESGYYSQAVRGHLDVLSKRRPLSAVIADPATPPDLRHKLELVQKIRDFAGSGLLLPDNGSYRTYADLGRSEVVWNLVATPEFSLIPRTWCFPVAGCVAYRGYYARADAEALAEELRGKGDDVSVYGVAAYSTLGWFDDPVLNTFVNRPEAVLAGMIFHELAHQQLYVQGDSAFNEAFARTVEHAGVERWLRRQGQAGEAELAAYHLRLEREAEFIGLLARTRERLVGLYASTLPPEPMRREKQAIFASLTIEYQRLRESWGGYQGYDRWFESEPNNARLAAVNTYQALVPALQNLLARQKGDLAAFYREARTLGELDPAFRAANLKILGARL